ncbi:MAG: sulfotransferase [Acidimicrobiales bacterium]|nr:sulfotransferase [Acidimicrobiales bacterium]
MTQPHFAGPQPPAPLPTLSPYGGPQTERSTVTQRARGVALDAFRMFGATTASLRVRPDYLIIGTKRGGSTSLARWVLEHPNVAPLFPARETRKGTYFFDVNYDRGERWYRSHFPTRTSLAIRSRQQSQPLMVGEAVPYYLHHPHAAARARAFAPAANIIALLRDPTDRAYGHWGERTRNGVEWLSFPDALAAEDERLAGEEDRMLADPSYQSFAHQHYSYVDQGRYERGLRRWMHHWPAEQLLVLRSEDMYSDPARIYAQVTDFLGLPRFEPEAFAAWNMKASSVIEPIVETQLRATLAPSVQAVEELLGRPMGWPS